MRCVLIVCILLSVGSGSRGQLNYEGNPLTETIDYTAQESKATKLNAQQDYQRFEVTDGRMINFSKLPFAPSAIDPLTVGETRISLPVGNAETKNPTRQIPDNSFSAQPDKSPIHGFSNPISTSPRIKDSPVEARGSQPFQSSFQQSYQPPSQNYNPLESSSPTNSDLFLRYQNRIAKVSEEALQRFLNSRTPEESEVALQTYLASQSANEHAGFNRDQKGILDTSETVNPTNREFPQTVNNIDTKFSYPQINPNEPQVSTKYPAFMWNRQNARRDNFYYPIKRPRNPFRGPIRSRANPWPRIGSSIYRPKEPIYGPPPLSTNWKEPVELIYTKPPLSVPPTQFALNNPTILHEDPNKWIQESDFPPLPTQKDIYYSQLYAQSYDPHYYNYIAKTGKIKPWLYGKLGKTEEKSIWWELLTGFKNHGMKNMMNPMFLLGMSIPTLTLVLSALIQKRSAARANINGHYLHDFIEKYENQIREAISNSEEPTKEIDDPEENRNRRKRSIGHSLPDLYPYKIMDEFSTPFMDGNPELKKRIYRNRNKSPILRKIKSVETSNDDRSVGETTQFHKSVKIKVR